MTEKDQVQEEQQQQQDGKTIEQKDPQQEHVKEERSNELSLTLDQATKQLIAEKKTLGQIHYDELTKSIASPYELDANAIDKLIQQVEDSGIAVVGDDGGPTKQQMVRAEEGDKSTTRSEERRVGKEGKEKWVRNEGRIE